MTGFLKCYSINSYFPLPSVEENQLNQYKLLYGIWSYHMYTYWVYSVHIVSLKPVSGVFNVVDITPELAKQEYLEMYPVHEFWEIWYLL